MHGAEADAAGENANESGEHVYMARSLIDVVLKAAPLLLVGCSPAARRLLVGRSPA